mmetsp:Transcript_25185/g.63579  ORF Transcript_25185/g.63579 Transcript_25185/m.63579 type:complete len:385 (+) Transcript_25185:124-1278(+)
MSGLWMGRAGMEESPIKAVRIQAKVPIGRVASPPSSPRQMEVSFPGDSPPGMSLPPPSRSKATRGQERKVLETEIFSFASVRKAKQEAVSRRHVSGDRRVLPDTPSTGRYRAEGPNALRIGYEGFYMATLSPDSDAARDGGFQGSDGITLDWEMVPMMGLGGITPSPKKVLRSGAGVGVQDTALARQLEAHCTELREALWACFDAAGDADGELWGEAWSHAEEEVADRVVSSAWGSIDKVWGNAKARAMVRGLLAPLRSDSIERFGHVPRMMLRALQRDAGADWIRAYETEEQPEAGEGREEEEARMLALGPAAVQLIRGLGLLHLLIEVGRMQLPDSNWEGASLHGGFSWKRLGLRSSLLMRMALAMQGMSDWETGNWDAACQ